jgi:hypothetical protein
MLWTFAEKKEISMNVTCRHCGTQNSIARIPAGRLVNCGACRNLLEQFVTYYDVLKVSKSAPVEVITAAYRSLAKKHHPDTNHGSAEATKILQEINESYSILLNPTNKAEHDTWIRDAEETILLSRNEVQPPPPLPRSEPPPKHHPPAATNPRIETYIPNTAKWSLGLGIASLLGFFLCFQPLAIGAVICGHKAHKEIATSNGLARGEGYAVTGLILGYFSLAISAVIILVALADA